MNLHVKNISFSVFAIALLAGVSVPLQASRAEAASSDCWPRGAAIAMKDKRAIGNGSASCGRAAIPEYMKITVKHYYPVVPDATAFTGTIKKPASATNWTGSVRRCDNATVAEYYSVVQMVQWAERGTKTSGRLRIITCAGNGA